MPKKIDNMLEELLTALKEGRVQVQEINMDDLNFKNKPSKVEPVPVPYDTVTANLLGLSKFTAAIANGEITIAEAVKIGLSFSEQVKGLSMPQDKPTFAMFNNLAVAHLTVAAVRYGKPAVGKELDVQVKEHQAKMSMEDFFGNLGIKL